MLRNGDWTRQTTIPSSRAQDDDLVMSLVEVTLAQPKQERERYLSSVCAQDSELFKEVWKYVEWEEHMSRFLLDSFCPQLSSGVAFKPSELLDNRFQSKPVRHFQLPLGWVHNE